MSREIISREIIAAAPYRTGVELEYHRAQWTQAMTAEQACRCFAVKAATARSWEYRLRRDVMQWLKLSDAPGYVYALRVLFQPESVIAERGCPQSRD